MVDLDLVASRVLETSLDVQPGTRVWIHGWDHTQDIVSKLAWQCLQRGARVMMTQRTEDLWLRWIAEAPLGHLEHVSPMEAAALAETDVYIFTLGPKRPIPWGEIPEDRRSAASIWLDSRYDPSPFAQEWSALARSRGVRTVGIEATLATRERAEALHLNFEEWREVMYAGCGTDWRGVGAHAAALVPALSGEEEVHLTTPEGTDLRFRLDRRKVLVSDGLATADCARDGLVTFLPAGAVEVSAAEESAKGTVVYDVPIHSASGIVEDLTLSFAAGLVRESSATKGDEVFDGYLRTTRDAGRFAAFGLGLNPNLRFGYTQDDKVLGSVTVCLGDNEAKGGRNRAGRRDWWGAMSKATLSIGERIVVQDGKLPS